MALVTMRFQQSMSSVFEDKEINSQPGWWLPHWLVV